MKLSSLVLVSLVAGLSLTACGDDDDSGGGGTGGSGTGGSGTGGSGTGGGSSGGMAGMCAMAGMGGMGAMGGMAGTGGSGTGGSGTGGSGTGGSGTGGSGTGGSGTGGTDGGTDGGGGNMTPDKFCASYEMHCGFGTTDHYASSAECKTKYAAFSDSRKTCANTHLAMAADKASIHCTHAAGAAPCN